MATVTLVQNASYKAGKIHTMTARPMNVKIKGLKGGAIQFTCSNSLSSIKSSTSVDITYDASVGSGHQSIQVSSVLP